MAKTPTSKARAPRRPSTRTKPTTTPPIPPQLAGLFSLVYDDVGGVGTDHADECGRALVIARDLLRDVLRSNDTMPLFCEIAGFMVEEAARGPWKELHRCLQAIERSEDSPHANAVAGDYQNVYGGPAFIMGVTLAYVYLAEGAK